MSENETNMTQQQQVMCGMIQLITPNSINRLLGAFYTTSWYVWMETHGEQVNTLLGMGYNICAVFLLISAAGTPVVITKQASKCSILGQEDTSHYLLRKILGSTLVLGLVLTAIMYIGSPILTT